MTITLSQMAKFSNGKKKNGSAGVIPVYGGNGIFDYTDSANSVSRPAVPFSCGYVHILFRRTAGVCRKYCG